MFGNFTKEEPKNYKGNERNEYEPKANKIISILHHEINQIYQALRNHDHGILNPSNLSESSYP